MKLTQLDTINRGETWRQWISGRTTGVTLDSFFKPCASGLGIPAESVARTITHVVTEDTRVNNGGDGWWIEITATNTQTLEKRAEAWGIVRSNSPDKQIEWLGYVAVEYGDF